MKIALINPRGASFLTNNPDFLKIWQDSERYVRYRESWSGFNSGLLIVSALTPDFFEVSLIDENYEQINFNEDYDLIAISGMTQQITRAYEIAYQFRKRGKKVIIGGIHATILPLEAKNHADSVIIGEAEELWPEFIQDFLNNKIKPFYKADNVTDLTKSPIPHYEKIDFKRYKYEMIWIQTTRGCPRDCEFCAASNIYGTKYRRKTIEQVRRELAFVKKCCGHNQIGFADDNMFLDRKYSKELIKEIAQFNLKWFAQTDISVAEDDNFLKLLKQSGCSLLFIGFESLSEQNKKFIDKKSRKFNYLNKYEILIKKIQSYGIGVMGAFIVGFDHDDLSVFKRTIDFIIDNNLYAAQICILTPLPGTRLRERLLKEDRILSNNWINYDLMNVTFLPKKMSPDQLLNGLFEIHKQIYRKEVYIKKAKYFKNIFLNLMDEN